MPFNAAIRQMSQADAERMVKIWQDSGYNQAEAARAAGLPRKTFAGRLEKAVAMTGEGKKPLAPAIIPQGFVAGKRTVAYDAQGNVMAEWRRLYPEADALQAMADSLCTMVGGKSPALRHPAKIDAADLMLEVPIFDAHFGKYCWGTETGTDFDSSTAERMVVGAVSRICQRAGAVGTGLLVIGGDFFHADSRHNTTERGGHALDVDTRSAKVWEVAARAIHRSVETMAQHAAQVVLVVIPGNHDWESAFHLQRLLAAYYRNEKGVIVQQSPRSRQYVQHGKVLIGFAHGHLMGMGDLASLMAQEVPEWWATTTERVWHLGHIHKRKGMRYVSGDTFHGVQVEHLESLAGTDAWHHENGFVGNPRRIEAFAWHRLHGLAARYYVTAEDADP